MTRAWLVVLLTGAVTMARLRVDAKAVGLAIAALAAHLRAPPFVVLAVAVCATAAFRAFSPLR